jgi:hypothetical protein
MKYYIKKLLREGLMVEDYFNAKLPNNIKKLSKRYVGRGVTWYGDPNQMIVIHKDYVDGMWGNIYDTDKFDYVVDMIKYSEENVEFECSYAMGSTITLTDIIEEQNAYQNDRFEIDYEGKKEPASIGDDELDKYIGKDDYIELEYNPYDDVNEFFVKYRFTLINGVKTEDDLIHEFTRLFDGDEDAHYIFEEFIRIETEIKESIDNGYGDMGEFRIQLRDGHHRVMGAIEAGEQYICVNLDKDDVKKFADRIKLVK